VGKAAARESLTVEAGRHAITNEDGQIVFDDSGEGRTVVWLHGLSEDRWSWEPVTRQLLDEMRCLRIDFRGHGDSNADGLIEEKLVMGLDRVPEPRFGELEQKFRAGDQEVVLDIWRPMLDADPAVLGAADDGFALLLGAISVPYLALHGSPVEAGYQQWFQSTNPNAVFESWDGMGHWLHLVDPDRFADRIRRFLTQSQ
jgi:pimeloyl-ACP methyl ester carboxylesterase